MPSALLRGLTAACLLLGPITPAPAQSSFESLADDYFEIATEVPLPRAMRPGWVPVRLTVRNKLDQPLSTNLIFSNGYYSNIPFECKLALGLGPQEERGLEVMVPYFYGEDVRLRVSHDRGWGASGAIHRVESSSANKSSAPMLVVTSDGYGLVEDLQGIPITLPELESQYYADESSTPAVSAKEAPDVQVMRTVSAGILANDLSTDWRAYSTLMLVAVDLDAPLPSRAAMDALLQWTELGGSLILLGSRTERADELLSSVGVRRQSRLEIENRNGASVHRHGFGRIAVFSNDGSKDFLKHFLLLQETPTGVFPKTFLDHPPPLPGVGMPPLNLLALALIFIAFVMGPIQFSQMKKRGAKPWRFLQVTPILGISFACIILIGSLLSNGLNVRESVQSVTWLDQERRTAATIAGRTSFSGSLFEQTQLYGAEALTLPAVEWYDEVDFLVDLGEGGRLSGHFLPTRVPIGSALISHSPARSGVRLERENNAIYVVNDLDIALHKLRLVDDQGNSYQTSNPKDSIEAGERVALTPTENLFDVRLRRIQSDRGLGLFDRDDFDSQRLRHLPPTLPRRSWMAEVDRSPFLPDGGVAREEDEGVHLILGILEEQS